MNRWSRARIELGTSRTKDLDHNTEPSSWPLAPLVWNFRSAIFYIQFLLAYYATFMDYLVGYFWSQFFLMIIFSNKNFL